MLDSNDFSTYNALEAQLTRRFSSGISFNVAYTWSKSLDTRSFDPTLTVVGTGNASTAADTPFDINNRRLNYAYSDFDRRHDFQWNVVAELPFGKGKHFLHSASGLVDRVLGGWEVTGYGRVTSGRPFTAFSGSNTVSNVNQSTANCTGCSRGDGTPFTETGLRPDLVLRRRRSRQILRPRRRPVRQYRPQLLHRTALVRNRCVAPQAHRRHRARASSNSAPTPPT